MYHIKQHMDKVHFGQNHKKVDCMPIELMEGVMAAYCIITRLQALTQV